MPRIVAAIVVTTAIILTAQVRLGAFQAPAHPPDPANKVSGTAAPRLVPFQGHLTRPRPGDARVYEAVPDGRFDVLFTLYTAPVGGESRVWGPERHEKLVVVNGLVNALIGSVDKGLEGLGPDKLAGPLYVGVTIDADGKQETPDLELVPRQVLLPAMYAHEAGHAVQADRAGDTLNNPRCRFDQENRSLGNYCVFRGRSRTRRVAALRWARARCGKCTRLCPVGQAPWH